MCRRSLPLTLICSAFAARSAAPARAKTPSIQSLRPQSGLSSPRCHRGCPERIPPLCPRKHYARTGAATHLRRDGAPQMAEQRLYQSAPKSAAREAKVVDRVFMHDLVLDVDIGVYTHEKGVTQRVGFSVDVDLIPAVHALNDDIRQAFDYDTIIKGIKTIIARGHINLVETLAEEVAMLCLAHPRAQSVRVMIEKLDKEPGAVGIEIVRGKARV